MITDLNEILVEWSYRTSDGKPDVNNSAKLILLEKVLDDFGWSREARAELLGTLMEAPKQKGDKIDPETKVKYKIKDKDGKDVDKETTYKSAISREKDSPAYIAAKALQGDGGEKDDGEKLDEPSEFDRDVDSNKGIDTGFKRGGDKEKDDEEKDDEEVTGKNALKVRKNLDNIDGPDVVASNGKTRKENAEQVMNLVNRYDNAETDDEKKAALKDIAESKLFSKTSPGLPKTKKFYIGEMDSNERKATKDKDHPKGYGRIDPTTGLSYDLIGGKNAKAFAFKINKDIDRLGNPGIKMVGELAGRKRMAGDNLLRGQAGADPDKDAPVETVTVTKTDTGVIIGKSDEHEGYTLDYITETLSDKELKAAGLSEESIEQYKGQTDLHNQRVKKFAESDNFEVFQILDPESGEPLNPATIEGRRKSVGAIVGIVKSRYEKLIGEDLSSELQEALNNLKKEADDYASGKTKQGKKLRETILKEFYPAMYVDENGRPSASDISETVSLLSDLSMGRYTVLPSKSNFAVSDVISASMRAKLDKNSSVEEIRNAVKVITTTAKGPTSVKFEKGGASQSSNKILDTGYNSATNILTGEKITDEEVKEDLKELADPIYEELYSYKNESIEKAKSKTDDIAKKYGIKNYPEDGEEYDENKHIYKSKEIYEGRLKIPDGKYHQRAKKWMKDLEKCPSMNESISKKDKDGNDLNEEQRLELAHKKLVDVYEQIDKAGGTMQRVNNNQMKEQLFTNRIYKVLINKETKKRETKVIETNGLDTLAGMAYSDDPGFDVGCAKPRNKMPSRITTVKKG